MDQPINTFRSIIEAVMTNWTALKMAVELSPSPVMWKDHALDLINNVCDSFETTGNYIILIYSILFTPLPPKKKNQFLHRNNRDSWNLLILA